MYGFIKYLDSVSSLLSAPLFSLFFCGLLSCFYSFLGGGEGAGKKCLQKVSLRGAELAIHS